MLVVDGDERGDGVALDLQVGGEAEEEKYVLLSPAVVGVEYEVHALFHRGMLLLRTAYFLEVLPWVVVPSATTILARRTISCYCAGGNQFTWPLSPEVGRASALGTLSWNSLSFMC